MEWSIQEVARLAGVTSRTLRHYDRIGLLAPSGTGTNGYRRYDGRALVRLQRILLLRQLGLGLTEIAAVLDGSIDDADALREHLVLLNRELDRVRAQIAAVETTMQALKTGENIMAEFMFEGFDQTRYAEEVAQRWGADTAARSGVWWQGLGEDGRAGFLREHRALQDAYDAAIERGLRADDDEVQRLARRHVEWIAAGWQGVRPNAEAVRGIADMYVADERFAENYTRVHPGGARFVRDALQQFAAAHLG